MNKAMNGNSTAMDLWFCKGCSVVHLRAGDVQMSFDRGEFQQLAERIAELSLIGWSSSESSPIKIGDSVALVDDVFLSAGMH